MNPGEPEREKRKLQSQTYCTFVSLKGFEDRTQMDCFNCLSISTVLDSTKIIFQFLINHCETGLTLMNVKLD